MTALPASRWVSIACRSWAATSIWCWKTPSRPKFCRMAVSSCAAVIVDLGAVGRPTDHLGLAAVAPMSHDGPVAGLGFHYGHLRHAVVEGLEGEQIAIRGEAGIEGHLRTAQ